MTFRKFLELQHECWEVSDGQPVNAAISNAAWVSRVADTNTTGKLDLDNPDAASGTAVANVQRELNGQDSFVTDSATVNTAENRKPTWSSDAIGTPNQAVKERVDSVQAQVEQNDSDIDTKIGGIGSSTDNAVVRFDGATGDTIQDSGVLVDDSNNVTIPGNLTVTGTTTTVGAEVVTEDPNITLNSGGTQAGADTGVSGFTVEMSDATDARVGYDSSLTSRFKAGEVGSEVEIATVSGAQAFTNKDYDGGTASDTSRITFPQDTKANLDGLTRKEGTVVYANDEDKLYYDDGVTLVEVGSGAGSGSGRVNFLDPTDADLESGTGNWVAYDDTGAFVDGTGGSPSAISVVHDTDGRLVGDGVLEIAKSAADGSGEGVSVVSQIIDPAYRGRTIIAEFEGDFTDVDYVSGDFSIKAYDVTNSNEIPVVGDTAIPNLKGKFQVSIPVESTTQEVRLAFHLETDNASASAYEVYVDQVLLTVDQTAPGTVSETGAFTIPLANITANSVGTPTVDATGEYCRVGNMVTYSGRFSANLGTATNNNYAITATDFPVMDRFTAIDANGTCSSNETGGDSGGFVDLSAGEIRFFLSDQNGTAGRTIFFIFQVEIDAPTSALVSTTETLHQTSMSRIFVGANQAVSAATNAVNLDTEDFTQGIALTADTANDRIIVNQNGRYTISMTGRLTSITAAEYCRFSVKVNGARAIETFSDASGSGGVGASLTGTLDLLAGDLLTLEFSSTLDASYTINGGVGTTYLEVRKVEDFTTFSVYGETEYVQATSTDVAWPFGVGIVGDLTSIDLTPGEWDISFLIGLDSSGATTTTQVSGWFGPTAGNTSVDRTIGDNFIATQKTPASGTRDGLSLPPRKVVITEPTTYYLKGQAITSVTNLLTNYRISARKVK